MKTQILEEINRYREIMSLKPLSSKEKTILLEMNVGPILKNYGLEAAETSIRELVRKEAKNVFVKFVRTASEGGFEKSVANLRGGLRGTGKLIPTDTIESIIFQAERSAGKTLLAPEKLAMEQELRKIMVEEMKKLANEAATKYAEQIARESSEQIGKRGAQKATWEAIKKHFGKHWKKYAAAGILLTIFTHFYPGETPPEDIDDPETDSTPPVTTPDTTTRYRNCGDGPFSKGCYETNTNGPIHRLQSCLDVVSDGKFWTKTEAALFSQRNKTEVTIDEINNICSTASGDEDTGAGTAQSTGTAQTTGATQTDVIDSEEDILSTDTNF